MVMSCLSVTRSGSQLSMLASYKRLGQIRLTNLNTKPQNPKELCLQMINFVSIIDANDKPLIIECNTSDTEASNTTTTTTTNNNNNNNNELAWQVKYHKLTNMSLDYFESPYFQPTGRPGEQYPGFFKLFQLSRCIVYGHHVLDTGMKFVIGISEQDNKYTEMDIKVLFSRLQELYTQTKMNPFSTDLSAKKKDQKFEPGKQFLAQHIRAAFFNEFQTEDNVKL